MYGCSAMFWKRSAAEDGGTVWCPYLGVPCQMWFLWRGGTIRYLYGSFTPVRIRFFRWCTALYEALTDISHLAAVSQSGALLTYRRTCVYGRVLYFHLLTSLLPVTYLSSLISFTLRFWCALRFLFRFFLCLHTSWPAVAPTHNGSPVTPEGKAAGAWL
jgi:hypothetical protein